MHNKIHVVRRLTGGRAVLHDREVTYAVIAPLQGVFENRSLQETYRLIAGALNLGLIKLGVLTTSISQPSVSSSLHSTAPGKQAQCFVSVSRYEISDGTNRKIIGSAQKRAPDRFLQHGSILLGFDAALQQGCVNQPDPTIHQKIAPISTLISRDVQFAEVARVFATAFSEHFEVSFDTNELSVEEARKVEELELKYRSAEWTKNKCR